MTDTDKKVGGRLKYFLHEWSQITTDPYVLELVSGVKLTFNHDTSLTSRVTEPYSMKTEELIVVDDELDKLIEKGVIEEVSQSAVKYMSNIFLRPKKNGTYRLILNLKGLNEGIAYNKFKMETLDSIIKLMQQGCYMASLDLSDAYYTVPIDEEYRGYLCFPWVNQKGDKRIFAYKCLANGLSSAPRDFTKLLKPPLACLRVQGVTIAAYIDDTYIQGKTADECRKHVDLSGGLFERLGFLLNHEKSVFTPTQELQMLGFVLNSVHMTVKPNAEKREKIFHMCVATRGTDKCKIRALARVIGHLVACFPGVQYGKLHYRNMEMEKSRALAHHKGDFNKDMRLSKDVHAELDWWLSNIHSASRKIDHGRPVAVLRTDASLIGWGATMDGRVTGGRWTTAEAREHINYLELMAAFFGLKCLCSKMHDTHIRIELDNSTAVCYINEMGGTKSIKCNQVAQKLWEWCIDRDIWVSAGHIPGVSNVTADRASRNFNDRTEWKLDSRIFHAMLNDLGVSPDIDLFASRLNFQIQKYVSWQPDPDAICSDAFSLTWSDFSVYLFPPFCLINRCVQKVIADKARGVIITPLWPTQSWFTPLMHILTHPPLLLPIKCVTMPGKKDVVPPKHLRLIACRISGIDSDNKDFQQKLQPSLQPVGNQVLRNSTITSLASGRSIVVNNRSMRLKSLCL